MSDSAFHLVRTGSALLRGSLAPFESAPGGDGSPILGALVTAAGAVLSGGTETHGSEGFVHMTRLTASVLLGGTAATLAATLARGSDRIVAVLGVAFLVLPPAIGTSFLLHPDAALGGLLLTIAFVRRSPAVAWIAAFATPVALPAAVLLGIGDRAARRECLVGAVVATGIVVALSFVLPPGRRMEIVAGLTTGWSISFEGLPSTFDALRRVWAGGTLAVAPIVLFRWGGRTGGRALLVPWFGTLSIAVLLSEPGAFRAATAALIPPTLLLVVGRIATLGDPGGPAEGPRRPVLLAMLVPIAWFILGTNEDRAHRRDERERTARLAQIEAFARENLEPGAIASDETGTLAALSAREVRPLGEVHDYAAGEPPTRIVVLRGRVVPVSPAERRLFDGATFLASYAPLEFRRGPSLRIRDAIWIRRPEPVAGSRSERYAHALRAAWRAEQAAAGDSVRRAWEEAAKLEPAGLGLARESLGVLLHRAGDDEASAAMFAEALADPAAVRARGHLADQALSAGRLAEADRLVGEAFRFNPHLAEVWGTRARLLLHTGFFDEAMQSSARAIRLNPHDARVLANYGSFLWRSGEHSDAREMWARAVRADARILGFLGDYKRAPDDAPAPPLAPLYSDVGFAKERP